MAFKMKGFEPYSKIKDNKKPDGRAGSSSFQKKDETIPQKIARLRKEGKNKEADKLQKEMDTFYKTTDYDKD
jgi:hypothetical protein|tara:strand:+ start:1087 stop:1302 length:216 start_codon:yes stop_codon:yes gene_type:complete